LKLSSDGGDLVARNANETIVAPVVGSGGVCVWECGVRRSVLCWCVWQESGLSRREDVFTFNLVKGRFYKFCTFNATSKDNAAIHCITFQYKKGSVSSTLTGHAAIVNKYE
jgi:hypothetical protein